MAVITSLENLKKYEAEYKNVPVAKEILSDSVTPIEVLRRLKKVSSRVYILESVVNQAYWGRYTFLGYDPLMDITLKNGVLEVKHLKCTENKYGKEKDINQEENSDEIFKIGKGEKYETPSQYLRELICSYKSPVIQNLPTFTGGLVGFFAYDYIKYSEPVLNIDADDEDGFSDMNLMLFDKVIAFDNIMQRLVLITNISTENLNQNYASLSNFADCKYGLNILK